MKLKIATKLFLVISVIAVIPLLVSGFVGYNGSSNITAVAAQANQQIAELAMSDSMAALSEEKKIDLNTRTESVANGINEVLVRVQADTAELAEFATYLYEHPNSMGKYAYPSVYASTPNGAFASVEENQNSWLIVLKTGLDEKGAVSPTVMDEIYLTEFMDIKFRSIADNNPYAMQLYINTASQISRGMPFINGEYIWVNAAEEFPVDLEMAVFDFYFLADETHNPERKPIWTELYWDPA